MAGKTEKEKKSSSTSTSSLSSIWSIFMHADAVDMWLMGFGLLGAVCDGLGPPALLLITSKVVNNLGGAGPTTVDVLITNINKNALCFLYVAGACWVFCFIEGYCWTRTGERQASRMRCRYLEAVLRQDVEYFDLQLDNTTKVVTSVSSDSLIIQDVLAEKVPNFIMNVSTFIGSYVIAFLLIWRLALVASPSIILLIIPGLVYGRILMGLARRIRDEYDKAGTIVEQAISSVRTLYSFVGEKKTIEGFSKALEGSVRLGLRQGLAKGFAIGCNGIIFAIWSFMAWYGSRLVMYHGIKGGTVLATGGTVVIGGFCLGSALSSLKNFSEAASVGERVLEMLQRVPKIDSQNASGEILQHIIGEVEFRNVNFSYPSRSEILIFECFNLKVACGKITALVGGSGSGKSTVVALLERLYDTIDGEILLDGVDIRRLRLKWFRAQMGLVSQEPALFATTIKENILFGKENATMEEVVVAAKAANAHEFISQLPQGYDTQVGERGVEMSGGQKQRIAIARAVIKSPKILLLDEATSALDSESERIVQEAIDTAAVGRTTMVIAHRLSTIRNADTIVVINNGKVVETGSHHQLISNPDGPYASLVRLQDQSSTNQASNTFTTTPTLHNKIVRCNSNSRRLSSSALSRSTSSTNSFHQDQTIETSPPSPPLVPSFQRLLSLNKPGEWKQAALGCFCAILFGGIQPLYAYALGSTTSVYFLQDYAEMQSRIRKYCFIFLSLTFLSFLVNVVQHYNFAYIGESLTKRVRERMLSKILTFEVAWFDNKDNSTGAVCYRLSKDAGVVRSLVVDRMALLIQTASSIAFAFVLGLVIAWKLALVMIATQPAIILSFYFRRVLLSNMSGKALKAQAESGKLAAEAVSNIRTVTAFSSQDRIMDLFRSTQKGPEKENIRQSWYAGIGLGTSQCLLLCTSAIYFWYSGKVVANGEIGYGAVFQTFIILMSTGRVIADAGTMTTDLARGATTVVSVFDVLDRRTAIEPEDTDGFRPEKIHGDIEFRDVHFAYLSRPEVSIFEGFSLFIEAGKSTALVGQSGSGKSTVIGLIERFYDPIKGTVMIDQKDIREYHLRDLRRHVALVGQEPTLFLGSIKDNIAYGAKEGVTETEIIEAAKAANAHDFVAGLKEGYDTWCGDKGSQLSGGQKQRIAIARAILKNPAILLLDEATSALDGKSESLVQEALDRMMVGRTSMVVAHRLSTVRNCDVIAVLDKGKVVEKGNHSSLMAKGSTGAYYALVAHHQEHQHQQPVHH